MSSNTSDRLDRLTQLKRDVDELTKPRERGQWVNPDKYHGTLERPDLAEARRGGFYWPPHDDQTGLGEHQPLLTQLEQLRDGYSPRNPGAGGRAAPGPRPTGGSDTAELVAEITAGAMHLRKDAMRALGVRRTSSTASTLPATLTHLTVLAESVDTELRDRICRQVHSWLNAARLTLSYTAPMMSLPDRTCTYCHQQSLITRSDASGDVFCSTADCRDENGQQPRWPKATWHLLLTS